MKSAVKIVAILTLLGDAVFMAWRQYAAPVPAIKIGVLHSLSGVMATSEKPLVEAQP
jgi:urea transport system substrate-binding protein